MRASARLAQRGRTSFCLLTTGADALRVAVGAWSRGEDPQEAEAGEPRDRSP
jgi:hypothetical protein